MQSVGYDYMDARKAREYPEYQEEYKVGPLHVFPLRDEQIRSVSQQEKTRGQQVVGRNTFHKSEDVWFSGSGSRSASSARFSPYRALSGSLRNTRADSAVRAATEPRIITILPYG